MSKVWVFLKVICDFCLKLTLNLPVVTKAFYKNSFPFGFFIIPPGAVGEISG